MTGCHAACRALLARFAGHRARRKSCEHEDAVKSGEESVKMGFLRCRYATFRSLEFGYMALMDTGTAPRNSDWE
jgi:hypothetical protein